MADRGAQQMNMIQLTDFLFSFCGEKKPGNGEDSYAYAIQERRALLGVFDGCGGSGATQYPGLQNKTGAYLAARAAAAACLQEFDALGPDQELETEALKERTTRYLRVCEQRGGESGVKLMGSLTKRFPTTAAAAVCRPGRAGIELQLWWAGDSRIYWMDGDGLAQLTEDDVGGIDPMENLSRDAILTNAVSLSREYEIHTARLNLRGPGLLFASTDGCFGYLSTPMEFEYLVLNTLQLAASPADWEKRLKEEVSAVSGDDYTLCGLSLGYGSFSGLQRQLRRRKDLTERMYINGLDACTREEKQLLWERYKANYLRFLCRG